MTHGYEYFIEYDFVDIDDYDFDYGADDFEDELDGYEDELIGYEGFEIYYQ